MNWLMPEPASDILAQIDALLDPRHPKTTTFLAPGNKNDLPDFGKMFRKMVVVKPWGSLVSLRPSHRVVFEHGMPCEATMAEFLGYPEPKVMAMVACPPAWLRVVQALDWQGNVITEALCSPGWFDRTGAALRHHGDVRILTVDQALGRRFALRCKEAA